MRKNIIVLGSTGSIGQQTLQIARDNRDRIEVYAISCGQNIELLMEQIDEFQPTVVVVKNEEDGKRLRERHRGLEVLTGEEGIVQTCAVPDSLVVNGLVGIMGLVPTIAAIEAGNDVALANKETLVTGGRLVMDFAREKNVSIIPIDSEHSAILQCLRGNEDNPIRKIVLTASGGPFRRLTKEELDKVTAREALKHPNWTMGPKITVDSATLMNKGLEVIEAGVLYGLSADEIEVIIHPESIIHSMVEFEDGAYMAQMGVPDMKVPISYALFYPQRVDNNYDRMDMRKVGSLNFEEPDLDRFPCLRLAYEAYREGNTYPTVLNGGNEVLVELFLEGLIGFNKIPYLVEKLLDEHDPMSRFDVKDILEVDRLTRNRTLEIVREMR